MKSLFAARILGLGALLASGLAWGQAELTPPPPPPPVEAPAPGALPEVEPPPPPVPTVPPPPPGNVEPQPQLELPKEKEEVFSTVRFAPTAHLAFVGFNAGGPVESILFASSLRAGLRFSVTPRRPENYAWGVGISLELGLEGLGFLPYGPQIFGMGITLKFGPAAITRGGLYFPFFDFYVLYTAVPSRFGFGQKLGAGLNFNLIALLAKERRDSGASYSGWSGIGSIGAGGGYGAVALAILVSVLMPSIELVFSPPTNFTPYSTLEVRFGMGF